MADPIEVLRQRGQRRPLPADFIQPNIVQDDPSRAVPGLTRAAQDPRAFQAGYEFDPVKVFSNAVGAGAKTLEANNNYFRAIFNSLVGNEEGVKNAVFEAQQAQVAGAGRRYINPADELWAKEPTFETGMNAFLGFAGEMAPSAAATITEALLGAAIFAYTAPVSVPVAGTAGFAGTLAASAGVKSSASKLASNLAVKGLTKKMIKDSIAATAAKKTLTKEQSKIMNLVYQNYQKQKFGKNLRVGALIGAGQEEYRQGGGTFFGNYAEQGMTDPVSAFKSLGLAVPFTAAGLGTEALLFKAVSDVFKSGTRKSLLTGGGKSYAGRRALGATGLATVGEGTAETFQTGIEGVQKFYGGENFTAIDDEYTAAQLKLDLMTSFFAGASGGFGVGGSAASVGAVTAKANELLNNHSEKKAMADMFMQMQNDPMSVQVEPSAWIEGQFDAMLDPTSKKDTVWVDVNSIDQLNKVGEKLQQKSQGRVKSYTLKGPTGGVLFSTNSQKIESFANLMETNLPSKSILEQGLAQVLDYSRTRKSTDGWVVQVRDKKGNLVHYHQTGDPKEEGATHLQNAKNLFNNSDQYTYDIVDAKTHLDERAEVVGPEVSIRRVEDFDLSEEGDTTGDIQDQFQEGRTRFDTFDPKRTQDPIILNRKNKPFLPPNPDFAQDQMPSEELIEGARSVLIPEFLEEFNNNLENDQYSRLLLRKLISTAESRTQRNEDGTVTTFKIEPVEATDTEPAGYGIAAYEYTPPPVESYSGVALEAEMARIIKRAKATKNARRSNFQIVTKDPNGKEGNPISVDMPLMVNRVRNFTKMLNLSVNTEAGGNLGGVVDAFTDLIGLLNVEIPLRDTNGNVVFDSDGNIVPKYELLFQFNKITEESLNDPKAVIYTMDGGNRTFTLPQAQAARSETIESAARQERSDFIKEVEDRLRKKLGLNPRNPNELRQRLKQIQDRQEKTGEQQGDAQNITDIETLLAEGTFDPADAGPQTTDPIGGQEGDPIFQDKLPEDYWNAEIDSYNKQPLSKMRGRYKAAATGNKQIQFSQDFVQSFGVNRGMIESLIKEAKKILNIKKDIKIFTTREADAIDVGDENINAKLREYQKEIEESPTLKGYNIEFKDFDVIILKVGIDPPLDIQGVYYKRLGHEIGHSFKRSELKRSITNPTLRKALLKAFYRDRKANPNIRQYQEENGFEEWYVDKVSAVLFDSEIVDPDVGPAAPRNNVRAKRGRVFKAKNLSDAYLKNIAKKLKAFKDSTRKGMAGQQARFAFDESAAEYINGVINVSREESVVKNEPTYEDYAHIEDTLDQVFGLKIGEKTYRKINRAAEKIIRSGEVPNWFKKLFYTAHGFLDGLGRDKGTGKEIADFFHVVSGTLKGTGMINEANRKTNEYTRKLAALLGMDKPTESLEEGAKRFFGGFTSKEQAIFREAMNEKNSNEQLSEPARKVREFLKQVFDDFELAKYGIEYRQNFFPRIIAIAEIAANPTKRAKLIELLVERNPGTTQQEATTIVEDLIRKNEDDPNLTTQEDSEFNVGLIQKRAKLFEALDSETLLEEGLIAPPEVAILKYIGKAARRSEYEKRGGAKRIEELVNELPEEERAQATEAINAMLGRIDPIRSDLWRHASSSIQLLNVLTLLGMAVFASVPDAAGPILRTRNFDLQTIAKNLYQAIGDEKEGATLAKDIGANGLEAFATTILYAGEMDNATSYATYGSNLWFRFTQLERWTIFTRKFAAGMARDFILKHQEIVEKGYEGDFKTLQSIRYLKELDLTVEDIKNWDGKNLDNHPKIKTALGRFVDEAIVRPNAAERPIWASDPHFAVLWQLKSFYYAYGKNIVGGLFREGKARYGETNRLQSSVAPLLFGAALLAPLTMLGWDLRERFKIGLSWLLPGISPQDTNYRASRSMGYGEYWFEILDRSGALGPYALALPLVMEDKRYGNPFFIPIAGPTAERAWDIVTLDTDFFDFVPAYSQLNTSKFNLREN